MEIWAWQTPTSKKEFHGVLAPIGQTKGARFEPEETSYANVLQNYQQAFADFMVEPAQGWEQRRV